MLILAAALLCCQATPPVGGPPAAEPTALATPSGAGPAASGARADVAGVTVQGAAGAWQFAVTVRSDETGCDRYADWWEVLRPDGSLVYRRILQHSHPTEQPFTRDGGPVGIGAHDPVVVRAHLHGAGASGYGGALFSGTPSGGFTAIQDALPDFPASLESAAPQPTGCLF